MIKVVEVSVAAGLGRVFIHLYEMIATMSVWSTSVDVPLSFKSCATLKVRAYKKEVKFW
jgi:hypothetical protein